MEIEGKDESGSFEDDHLVVFMLAAHIAGIGSEPAVLGLETNETLKN